jgi:hypothetical protein
VGLIVFHDQPELNHVIAAVISPSLSAALHAYLQEGSMSRLNGATAYHPALRSIRGVVDSVLVIGQISQEFRSIFDLFFDKLLDALYDQLPPTFKAQSSLLLLKPSLSWRHFGEFFTHMEEVKNMDGVSFFNPMVYPPGTVGDKHLLAGAIWG